MPVSEYRIILDTPSTAPALGFDSAANALKDIILRSNPNFVIGIFGTWGSGKTTLMRAIERRLEGSGAIKVQFSAWRYEREPHLIVPLLDTMREALVAWSEKNVKFRDQAMKTASTVGKAIYSLLAGMSLKASIPSVLDVNFDASKAFKRAEDFDSEASSAKMSRSFYHSAFKALSETFADFLGKENERRIVVFVDDLDRCLPQGALEVLEAMKLFFDMDGFVFVVGLDRAVVERSIDLKYKLDTANDKGARPSGDDKDGYQVRGADYIKKIFQLPYALSPVSVTQLDEFLNAIYQESGLDEDQQSEIHDVVAPHLRYLVTESGINPREIKRYINAYTLVIKIRPLQNNVILALQTITFRRDWAIVQRALLSYREAFLDALKRLLAGELTAVVDLDPDLAGVPESFLSYVTLGNPGADLLNVYDLETYLYAGASTTTSQGGEYIAQIREVAKLGQALRTLSIQNDMPAFSAYRSLLSSTFSPSNRVSSPRVDRLIQEWTDHANLLGDWSNEENPRQKNWLEEEQALKRKFMNQLLDMSFAG